MDTLNTEQRKKKKKAQNVYKHQCNTAPLCTNVLITCLNFILSVVSIVLIHFNTQRLSWYWTSKGQA